MPGGGARHLNQRGAGGARVGRHRDRSGDAQIHRQRQWHGAHQSGSAGLGQRDRRGLALHRAGQAAAERLRRELHRSITRRVPERGGVRYARRRAPHHRALAARLQREETAHEPRRANACRGCARLREWTAWTRCRSRRPSPRSTTVGALRWRRTHLIREGAAGSRSHAYSRFLRVKGEIEGSLPTRGGKKRELTKEDFSQKGAIFLRAKSQFDYLVELPDGVDRAKAIIEAMTLIEDDYQTLRGTLPKNEYQELDNEVLGRLLRVFNDPALKQANGDIFGRIYEYFLTGFADLKAHDGGEFFTPVSLVQMIVNVIEPDHGTVLDPACGSGGMFVQSAHFIESMKKNPSEQATFYGMEKNPTTIRLAKM